MWQGEIQQDTGELFYIEAAQDQSTDTHNKQQNVPQTNGSKKKKKSPLPMPKLMRRKKEQKHVDNTLDQVKRASLKRTSFLSKTGSVKEVALRLDKNSDVGVSRTSKLESWLGIISAGIPLTSSSSPVVANGNREHHSGGGGGSVKVESILVKGLLPSGVAMKSGDIDIGK